ncbi:MAG: VOC family protein [Chloroflexota bacterium]
MAVSSIRPGFQTVTPYIIVQDIDALIDFVKKVFDATETLRLKGSAGGFHVEISIGNSMMMLGGGGAWEGNPIPAALYVYVDDVDAIYQRALQAGATTLMEPTNEFDGDRRCGVQDPFGNQWFIATHIEDVSTEEMTRRWAAMQSG